jgi:hypothetical protein
VMEQEQSKESTLLSWIYLSSVLQAGSEFLHFRSYAICSRLQITLATEMGAMQSVLHPVVL